MIMIVVIIILILGLIYYFINNKKKHNNQNIKNTEANDNELKKPINIKFTHFIIGIIIIAILLIVCACFIVKYNNLNKPITSATDTVDSQTGNNNILDVIDQENQEFKINGMQLVNAINDVYEEELGSMSFGYKNLGTSQGITMYSVSCNLIVPHVSVESGGSYPAILIGIRENTGNVVVMSVGDPHQGNNYLVELLAGNISHLEKGLDNLGYNQLSATIHTIANTINDEDYYNKYKTNGLNGVFINYIGGVSSAFNNSGSNYFRFTAMYPYIKGITNNEENSNEIIDNNNTNISNENTENNDILNETTNTKSNSSETTTVQDTTNVDTDNITKNNKNSNSTVNNNQSNSNNQVKEYIYIDNYDLYGLSKEEIEELLSKNGLKVNFDIQNVEIPYADSRVNTIDTNSYEIKNQKQQYEKGDTINISVKKYIGKNFKVRLHFNRNVSVNYKNTETLAHGTKTPLSTARYYSFFDVEAAKKEFNYGQATCECNFFINDKELKANEIYTFTGEKSVKLKIVAPYLCTSDFQSVGSNVVLEEQTMSIQELYNEVSGKASNTEILDLYIGNN